MLYDENIMRADAKTLNFLLSEIQTVRKIYDALDEGVETNSQIHHSLLDFLGGDSKSNSPIPVKDLELTHTLQDNVHRNHHSSNGVHLDHHVNNKTTTTGTTSRHNLELTNSCNTQHQGTTYHSNSHGALSEDPDQYIPIGVNSTHQRSLPQVPPQPHSNPSSASIDKNSLSHKTQYPQAYNRNNEFDLNVLKSPNINHTTNDAATSGLQNGHSQRDHCPNQQQQQHHVNHTRNTSSKIQQSQDYNPVLAGTFSSQPPPLSHNHTTRNENAKNDDVIITGNKRNRVTFVSSNRVVNSKTPSPTDLLLSSTPRQNYCPHSEAEPCGSSSSAETCQNHHHHNHYHQHHHHQQQSSQHNQQSDHSFVENTQDDVSTTPRGGTRLPVRKERQSRVEEQGGGGREGGGGGGRRRESVDGGGPEDLERGDQLERRSSCVEEHYRITTHNIDQSRHARKTINHKVPQVTHDVQESNSHTHTFDHGQRRSIQHNQDVQSTDKIQHASDNHHPKHGQINSNSNSNAKNQQLNNNDQHNIPGQHAFINQQANDSQQFNTNSSDRNQQVASNTNTQPAFQIHVSSHAPNCQQNHALQQHNNPQSASNRNQSHGKELPFNTYSQQQTQDTAPCNIENQTRHNLVTQTKQNGRSSSKPRVRKANESQSFVNNLETSAIPSSGVPEIGGMSTDALRNLVAQLQLDLMEAVKRKEEAQGQRHELETKLEATENTVLHQSRKMKTYRNALESAGVNVPLTHRSSSEASLYRAGRQWADHPSKSFDNSCNMKRRSSLGNVHWPGNRDDHMNTSSLSEKELKFTAVSSTPRKRTSARKEHSYSTKDEIRHHQKANHHHDSYQQHYPNHHIAKSEVKGLHHSRNNNNNKIVKGIRLGPQNHNHPNHHHHNNNNNITNMDNLRPTHYHEYSDEGGSSLDPIDPRHYRGYSGSSKSDFDSPRSAILRDYHPHHRHDHHNRHHRGRKHDINNSNTREEVKSPFHYYDSLLSNDFSQDKAAQLEAAITQQVHLLVTQREEINTHEMLLDSMGISLDKRQRYRDDDGGENVVDGKASNDNNNNNTNYNNNNNNSRDIAMTERVIKQLLEIRGMRQHLESLDLDGNAGHPFMYESHTNHIISHQESIISTLKHKLTDDENKMKTEINEIEERLSKERDSIHEQLVQTEAEVENQKHSVEKSENIIQGLESDLKCLRVKEYEMGGEIDSLNRERAENKEEMRKSEKENIELQKNLTTLELVKEDLESKLRVLETEVEDGERQRKKLKKDAVVYRETCKGLREAIGNKEDTLRDQMEALQVLSEEKTEVEKAVDNMKQEINCLREEQNKFLTDLEEKESIKIKFNELLIELDQKRVKERQLVKEKTTLEAEVEVLQEDRKRAQQICEVQHGGLVVELSKVKDDKLHLENRLSTLEIEAKSRKMLEEEIISIRTMFDRKCSLESELRRELAESEASLRRTEREKADMEDDLHSNMGKIAQRDRQCQHLCDKFNKLDLAFTKQNRVLREKTEDVTSLRRQIQLYEKTMDVNQNEKHQDTTTKELLNELVMTKKQVADLMTRLEGSSNIMPDVRVEAFGTDALGGSTTTTTTTTNNNTRDNVGTTTNKSQTIFVNIGGHTIQSTPSDHLGYSSSLFAILKQDLFEKIRGEMAECSADAKSLEGRDAKNNKDYEKQSQDITPACQRIRACMEEALRILSLAWITELPPMDSQGNFYNPELVEENECLKSELTRLRTKCDVLDLTVRNHQGRLDASAQRHKNWEEAVFRQYELMFRRPQTPSRIHVTHHINGINKAHAKP